MSDMLIFLFGAVVTLLVLLGTYVFTVYEFRQMGQNPEKYKIPELDNGEEASDEKIPVVKSA